MTRTTKTQATLEKVERQNAGIEAANDLRWRMEVHADPKHPNRTSGDMTNDAGIFAAWALTHFDMHPDKEAAFLDALGMKWGRTKFGSLVLMNK